MNYANKDMKTGGKQKIKTDEQLIRQIKNNYQLFLFFGSSSILSLNLAI